MKFKRDKVIIEAVDSRGLVCMMSKLSGTFIMPQRSPTFQSDGITYEATKHGLVITTEQSYMIDQLASGELSETEVMLDMFLTVFAASELKVLFLQYISFQPTVSAGQSTMDINVTIRGVFE